MVKPRILMIAVTMVSLTACSSVQYERRMTDYQEKQQEMAKWSQYEVDAWPKGTMPEDYSSPSEDYTLRVKAECLDGFAEGARHIQDQLIQPHLDIPYELYKAARSETDVVMEYANECADKLGADAQFWLVHEEKNSVYSLEGWVKTIHAYDGRRQGAAKDLVNAKEKDRQTRAVAIGAIVVGMAVTAAAYSAGAGGGNYVNPNQHWVPGYYRSDGTYVRGHWRTNPNHTCLDNLSGCR